MKEEAQLDLTTDTGEEILTPSQSQSVTSDEDHITPDNAPQRVRGVLTNRWNVFEFIGRQLIVPFAALKNNYPDLSSHTPGMVPVLETPLSDELVQAVTTVSEHDFPIFIELDESTDLGLVPIIKWTQVKRLHFASEKDLREHRARANQWENVPDFQAFEVTPEFFSGASLTVADLETQADRRINTTLNAINWSDRWSGAVLFIANTLQNCGSPEAAESIGRLFTDEGTASGMSFLPALRNMRIGKEPGKGKGTDQQLLAVIIQLIHGGLPIDSSGFIPKLMEDPSLNEETKEQLTHIAKVIEAEIDFEPFERAVNPTLRGLFIAKQRSNPETLAEWALNEANAQLEAVITAAAIHGLAVGRSDLSTTIRPEKLDQYLASLEYDTVLGNNTPTKPTVTREIDTNGDTSHEIRVAEVLIALKEPPTPLVDLIQASTTFSGQTKDLCIDLIESENWTDLALKMRIPAPDFKYIDGHVEIPGQPPFEYEVLTIELVKLLADFEPQSEQALKLRRNLTQSGGTTENAN